MRKIITELLHCRRGKEPGSPGNSRKTSPFPAKGKGGKVRGKAGPGKGKKAEEADSPADTEAELSRELKHR